MNTEKLATLLALLVSGSALAPAQTVDVQTQLANQEARIAELEKKVSTQATAGPLVFPEGLTPYILIDLTILGKNNATPDGRTKIDMPEPFFSGNRWGLKGLVNTNVDGLAVIYKLESEYFLFDGEQGKANELFNRDAWVGLSGKYGKLTIGRQNTLARDFAVIYCDPFNHAEVNYDEGGWTNNSNFKSMVYYAGAVCTSPFNGGPAGTRIDKGIVWKKVNERGLAFGAAFNANYETNTSTKNTSSSVALGWNAPTWHVSAFYTSANNGSAAGSTLPVISQKSMSFGGNINVTPKIKVNAGWFHFNSEQGPNHPDRSDNAYTLSASYSYNPKWTYFAGIQTIKVNHAGTADPTKAGVTIPNAFAYTANAAAYTTGGKDNVYCAVRRHLSKKIEAYVVYDYMKLRDDYKLSSTILKDSQAEYGVGLRISAL